MKTQNSQAVWEAPQAVVYRPISDQYLPKTDNSNYTILIVDDDQPTRELIGLYLKTLGYNVLLAENGAKALEFVKLYTVDMAFLDIMLPTMDGLAVCAAISKLVEIPIIMLTILSKLDYTARAFQLGADGYITKPFRLSTVKMRIQSLLHNGLALA